MAITATVTTIPNSGTISPGQRLKGVVQVANGNSTPVEVLSVNVWAARTGQTDNKNAANLPVEVPIPATPNMNQARLVNNSGNSYFPFEVTFYAPRQGATLTNAATQQYDIGALVVTSDGSVTNATVQTVTITAPSV